VSARPGINHGRRYERLKPVIGKATTIRILAAMTPAASSLIVIAAITLVFAPLTFRLYGKQG
jgi:hypothetical protein